MTDEILAGDVVIDLSQGTPLQVVSQSTKTVGEHRHTRDDQSAEMFGADPDDSGFVLRWRKDDQEFAVACDAYSRLRDNLRAVYLWVHETRMRNQRPVVTGEDEFAAARLPPGDEDAIAVPQTQEPHEVLGVDPDAPKAVVKGAARSLKAKHHPDQDDDVEQFKRVVEAEEAMLE